VLKQWVKNDSDVENLEVDRQAQARERAQAPALFRAMAETAEGQATVLLQASRSQGFATSAGEGFYYLGEARAAAESARFCSSLRGSHPAAPLPLRSVAPELRRLQEWMVAAFTPPRSLQQHGDFVVLNATLKLANDLDAAGLYAGTLYQYLEALQQRSRLDRAPPDAAQQARVRAALAALTTRLRQSRRDDSIGELFLERAEALLAGRNGAAPSPDAWKNAAVLAEQVLPAYFSALQPAPPPNPLASHPLAVTLVRWPYT